MRQKLLISKTQIINFIFMLLLCFNESTTVIRYYLSGTYYILITYSITFLAILCLALCIKRLPQKSWMLLLVVAIAIVYSLIYSENVVYIQELFNQTKFRTVWLVALLFGVQKNPDIIRKDLYRVAYIVLIINIYGLLAGAYNHVDSTAINYMGFGYTCVLWWAIIVQSVFSDEKNGIQKAIDIVSSVFVAMIVLFYGSRGSVLSLLVFLLYCFIKYYSRNRKIELCLLISAVTGLVYFFWNQIFTLFILATDAVGISSRNLRLLQSSLLTSDTHRSETVYSYSIELIKKHFLFGHGIGADRAVGGGTEYYSHNLILEVCVNFGVIIGVLIIAYVVSIGIKMLIKVQEKEWVYYFAPFFVTCMVQVMVSSSLYLVSEFWTFIFIYYAYLAEMKRSRYAEGINNWRQP